MGCDIEDKQSVSETSGSSEFLSGRFLGCWLYLIHIQFRDSSGKKKPVEKRKLEKHYLDFIKSSQRFYRGYIQRLASHFGGIQELEKVAQRFNFDSKHLALRI